MSSEHVPVLFREQMLSHLQTTFSIIFCVHLLFPRCSRNSLGTVWNSLPPNLVILEYTATAMAHTNYGSVRPSSGMSPSPNFTALSSAATVSPIPSVLPAPSAMSSEANLDQICLDVISELDLPPSDGTTGSHSGHSNSVSPQIGAHSPSNGHGANLANYALNPSPDSTLHGVHGAHLSVVGAVGSNLNVHSTATSMHCNGANSSHSTVSAVSRMERMQNIQNMDAMDSASARRTKRRKFKKKKQRRGSASAIGYDPSASLRAQGNIQISKSLTESIVPSMIAEPISNVYSYMDRACVLSIGHDLERNERIKVFAILPMKWIESIWFNSFSKLKFRKSVPIPFFIRFLSTNYMEMDWVRLKSIVPVIFREKYENGRSLVFQITFSITFCVKFPFSWNALSRVSVLEMFQEQVLRTCSENFLGTFSNRTFLKVYSLQIASNVDLDAVPDTFLEHKKRPFLWKSVYVDFVNSVLWNRLKLFGVPDTFREQIRAQILQNWVWFHF